MQFVACYNCGSSESRPYLEENGFTLVRCAVCGLLYVNPRPNLSEIGDAARTGAHPGVVPFDATGRFRRSRARLMSRRLSEVYGAEYRVLSGSWLDIGCGYGEMIHALHTDCPGLDVEGCEPNERKREAGRRRGLRLVHPDSIPAKDYRRISLMNVYSHLPDPAVALGEWGRLLGDRGELLLETGDAGCFTAASLPRPLYLPDHLSFASEEVLRSVLQSAGYEIVSVHRFPTVAVSGLGLAEEVVKALMPSRRSRLPYMLPRERPLSDLFVRCRRVGG